MYLNDERGKSTTKTTLPGKDIIQIQWRNQKLTDKGFLWQLKLHTSNAWGMGSISGQGNKIPHTEEHSPKKVKKKKKAFRQEKAKRIQHYQINL